MYATYRIDRQNRFGTSLLQGPDVGPVVDLMRWQTVRMTMPRQKHHFATSIIADLDFAGRCAIRRVHRQGLPNVQAFQLGQASPTNNRVNSHRKSLIDQLSSAQGLKRGLPARVLPIISTG